MNVFQKGLALIVFLLLGMQVIASPTSSIGTHSSVGKSSKKTVSTRLVGAIRGVRTLAVNVMWSFGLTEEQIRLAIKLTGAQFEEYAAHMALLYKIYNEETALDYLKRLDEKAIQLSDEIQTTTFFYYNNHTLMPEDKPRVTGAPKSLTSNAFFLKNTKLDPSVTYVVSGKMQVNNHDIQASVATDVSTLDEANFYQSNDVIEINVRYKEAEKGIKIISATSHKIGPDGTKTRLHILKSSLNLTRVFEM